MAEISPHSGIMKGEDHILPIRVYYEDTDAGGVVYYANYLKYMERGRSDMLRILGVDQSEMLKFQQPDDVKFVVTRSEIDYIHPARLDDELTIYTRLEKAGGARLMMAQEVRRGDEILARGRIKAAVLNKDDRPTRLPQKIITKIGQVK